MLVPSSDHTQNQAFLLDPVTFTDLVTFSVPLFDHVTFPVTSRVNMNMAPGILLE